MDHRDDAGAMPEASRFPSEYPGQSTLPIADTSSFDIAMVNGQAKPSFASRSDWTGQLPAPNLAQLQQNPRDTSVLANDVASHLSLMSATESTDTPSESSGDELETLPRPYPLPFSTLCTGLCYDVRMRYHCELDPPKERLDYHPEDPRRIFHIFRELCEAGLVDDPLSTRPLVDKPLMRIPARYATIEEICLVHTRAHYDFIEETKNRGDGDLLAVEKRFDSVYFNQLTWQSALLSAGGAIETCRAVASRQLKNAIAVIRPPGHHAEENRPMGFCMFDNVAIAAKVCQIDYKQTCRKILIVDWDVHHGNGIQQAFYSNPNVLYVSLHVHEDGRFYPAGPYGDHLHCGTGAGEGKNINVPWPTKGMGDADYMFAFQHIVMPVAHDFDPDLVIIAAGFDAAAGDQLGGCFVTPTCYAHMTHMLMSLAEGKLVVCLEGGYNLKSISKSALAVTRTLMGEPPDRMEETTATPSGIATVQKVVMYQSRYWRCLYPKDNDREISNSLGAERMHDVIRAYQSKHLYDTHKMISLFIFRERISRSFENQVIATTNYHKAVPLIVIFHDPPEVMGVPNPVTNKLELHNTWLADVLKHYIGWAVKQGFGVIDVNIPKHLTGIDDGTEYFEENKLARTAATEELAVYLWENYIECNDAQEIFFVGVGDAYHGVMHLLNNHEGFFERIAGVINFVAENPLRSVHDQNVYYLSKWYYKNSLVFVADNHLVWSPDGPLAGKKSTKRYGAFIRSPKVGLNEMLVVHQQQVQQFILQRVRRRSLAEAGSGRTATEVEGGVGTGMGPGMGSRMGTGSAGLLENAMSIETTMGMGEP